MQYTSKLAILAVALFSTSALAAPFASFESDLEVREADNELSAREFFDAYLEAREDPSLDARDLEALDLEAREYLEYLEMREVATATVDHSVAKSPTPSGSSGSQTPPQTPMSATSQEGDTQYPHFALLTQHRAAAKKQLEDPAVYKEALTNPDSPYHKRAVAKYLRNSDNLKAALGKKNGPYYRAAKRMALQKKAMVYLADHKHYLHALRSRHSKYYKAAVRQYLSDPKAFEAALSDDKAHFHTQALHQYLLDPAVRKKVIAGSGRFHDAAVELQEKLDTQKRKHAKKHSKNHSSSSTATSTIASATPTATHAA